jgi:hypothetical protein
MSKGFVDTQCAPTNTKNVLASITASLFYTLHAIHVAASASLTTERYCANNDRDNSITAVHIEHVQ